MSSDPLKHLRFWLGNLPPSEELSPSPWPIGLELLLEASPASFQAPNTRHVLVQSVWSKPYHSLGSLEGSSLFWCDRLSAFCCWSYSVLQASRFYARTTLVGDAASLRLSDRLCLPYTSSSEGLLQLDLHDPRMWSAGKLAAFSEQRSPFVHLDWDAILFRPLPERLSNARYFCQCADPLWVKGDRLSYLYARTTLEALEHQSWPDFLTGGLSLPFLLRQENAYNFGLFGCSDLSSLPGWCESILECLQDNSSLKSFDRLAHPNYGILFWEQLLISYLVAATGQKFECLFKDDHHRSDAYRHGFVHFISTSKHNPVAARLMREKFQKDYPEQYERCLRLDRDLPLNS